METVMIKTKKGNRPDVKERCVGLKYPEDQDGVVWVIDQPLVFTITFDKGQSPFQAPQFTNRLDTSKPVLSGPVKADPGDTDKIYKYTLAVDGYTPIDPGVIIFK